MKKFAFTLMELLMALAIIGITATLVAPALTSIMPDKTKMQFIKAHKVLADVTQDLLTDPYYYHEYSRGNLLNVGLAADGDYDNELSNPFSALENEIGSTEYNMHYKGDTKYCYLAAKKMEINDVVQSTSTSCVFTTIDGMKWSFEPNEPVEDNEKGIRTRSYKVAILLGSNNNDYKIASLDNTRPTRFEFYVDTYGKVIGHEDDKLAVQYLKTPTKFNNKKEDYKAAFGN